MKILITMAGKGSRFRDIGIEKPKHEIRVKGEPMFDWAMRSLKAFYDEEFIFVTQEEHDSTPFLKDACDRLGISRYQEKILHEYTSGQAQTALSAREFIDPSDEVVIYNIDTYIEEGSITPEDIHGDGFIPIFIASGERWSFVKTDDSNRVINVSEKNKISDLATAGFYYFDQWGNFVDAYKHTAEEVEQEYGETYVAPLYNHLIGRKKPVYPHMIERDAVHVLGTPDDLEQFDPSFSQTNR